MKKIFITILIVICFNGLLHAKDNNIYIMQYNKIIGQFTIEQFKNLVKASDNYKDIMEAQNEKRVTITCDTIKSTDREGEYKAILKVSWKNKKGVELNYITSEITLNIDNDTTNGISQWRIVFRNVAEIGFPITSGLLILLLLIII